MLKTTRIKLFACAIFALYVVGCGSQGSGLAPSGNLPGPQTPAIDTSSESEMHYGQTVKTASGWEISSQEGNSAETTTLANGWTVEALSE